jgi:hypothetical protein
MKKFEARSVVERASRSFIERSKQPSQTRLKVLIPQSEQFLAAKRLIAVAPRLIQAYQTAGLQVQQQRLALSAATGH